MPLDHHNKEHPALVPSADPAHAPVIDAIGKGHWFEQAEKLGFNFHGNAWMALAGGTVKAMTAGWTHRRPGSLTRLIGQGHDRT
jgi:hypothetical protein